MVGFGSMCGDFRVLGGEAVLQALAQVRASLAGLVPMTWTARIAEDSIPFRKFNRLHEQSSIQRGGGYVGCGILVRKSRSLCGG